MDHKEQHHQHHLKQREHEKSLEKERSKEDEKRLTAIHPLWFLVAGVVLVVLVVASWSIFFL